MYEYYAARMKDLINWHVLINSFFKPRTCLIIDLFSSQIANTRCRKTAILIAFRLDI